MFIVTAVETVGDISELSKVVWIVKLQDSELSGGVVVMVSIYDRSILWCFTKYIIQPECWSCYYDKDRKPFCTCNRSNLLILCGLFPKLAALISIMPQSVLGGAAVMIKFLLS